MIKNLLYSLFLHFILLMVIYANFNLKKTPEEKTNEISISVTSVSGTKESGQIKKNSTKKKKKKSKTKKKRNKRKAKKSQKLKKQKTVANKPSKSKKKVTLAKETSQKQVTKSDVPSKENKITNKEEKEVNAINKTANNIDSLDLSAREKFNIQSQLKRCYRRALNENELRSKLYLAVVVEIDEDGYIDSSLDYLTNSKEYNNPKDPSNKIAVDNIRRALELCSPLRNLPKDKYDTWKIISLEFDENEY